MLFLVNANDHESGENLDFEYIVATDLAARGIDIEGVSYTIMMPFRKTCLSFCSPCWTNYARTALVQRYPLPA